MRTLILSSWYLPHRIVRWEDAVTLMFLQKVDVLVNYAEEVRSPSTTLRMPAVVRLRRRVATEKRGPKFSRPNVYLRDGFRCAYCGDRQPVGKLTYDHVIPRAQGGRTEWENIVTACHSCNASKGNRTPDQAGMFPRHAPYRPDVLPILPPLIDQQSAPVEWRDYAGPLVTG